MSVLRQYGERRKVIYGNAISPVFSFMVAAEWVCGVEMVGKSMCPRVY